MRQSLVVALIALGLFGSPERSEAGLGDLIWELSGPQMFGLGINCRYDFKGNLKYCEWSASVPVSQNMVALGSKIPFWSTERVFWSWGAGGYVSTGWNDQEYEDDLSCLPGDFPCKGKEIDYRAFDHRMLSFEPSMDYHLFDLRKAPVFVSAGGALHSVWNRDAEQFWKAGFKYAVEIRLPKFAVAFNLRHYPDGFGVDEFGKGVFQGGDRPSELTWGVGMSFPLFKGRS